VLSCNKEGFINLLNEEGDIKEDLQMPRENETVSTIILNRFNSGLDVFVRIVEIMGVGTTIVEAYELKP
jgi:hypothetical protein